MSKAPFFKLFFSDLVGDTLHLSNAEIGSYFLLLGAMWNAGAPLQNDSARLARMARCSPKTWPRMWDALSPYFIVTPSEISNARLMAERQKADSISQERRNLSERRWKAKSLKNNKVGDTKASTNAMQPEPERYYIPDTEASGDVISLSADDDLLLGEASPSAEVIQFPPPQSVAVLTDVDFITPPTAFDKQAQVRELLAAMKAKPRKRP